MVCPDCPPMAGFQVPTEAFERIFGATIFFSMESSRSTATIVHRSRFNFLREGEIW